MAAGIRGLAEVEARRKSISYEVDVDPSIPPRLTGDPLRIRQVAFNLVANALKFTEQGGVRFTMTRVDADMEEMKGCHEGETAEAQEDVTGSAAAHRVTLRFAVSDTGPGSPTRSGPGSLSRLSRRTSQPRVDMAAQASDWPYASDLSTDGR
jgi:signal transduction histidine kinase